MKPLNTKSKVAISIGITALIVDMWRNFPWLGKLLPFLRPNDTETGGQ